MCWKKNIPTCMTAGILVREHSPVVFGTTWLINGKLVLEDKEETN